MASILRPVPSSDYSAVATNAINDLKYEITGMIYERTTDEDDISFPMRPLNNTEIWHFFVEHYFTNYFNEYINYENIPGIFISWVGKQKVVLPQQTRNIYLQLCQLCDEKKNEEINFEEFWFGWEPMNYKYIF